MLLRRLGRRWRDRDNERSYFKPLFGADFGALRVHTGPQAARTAAAINTRAFTVGNEIVFGADQYAPGTRAGRRLLAHELTHTLQNARATNQPRKRS
ncbi:MAG: DUF4157 domain-containing protein [Acidimicrobiia bacterium]|nr:DUF4157 domain-containing protein [Acidimicrobiia bacterium]